MTWEEVTTKSRNLIAPVLGAGRFTRLLERVKSMEKCSNVRELQSLLQN
jgi:hypothetical protein